MSPEPLHLSRCAGPRTRGFRAAPRGGFTLLELFVAFTLLTLFVLPLLGIVHNARMRALTSSVRREVRELAQRRLFERIYTYTLDNQNAFQSFSDETTGDFADFGHPEWRWEIPYPQIKSQGSGGEQVLLEYTIRVHAPQLDAAEGGGSGLLGAFGLGSDSSTSSGSSSGALSSGAMLSSLPRVSFEMTTWAIPSAAWYEEQQFLANQGIDTGYFGNLGSGLGGVLPAGGF